MSEEHYLKKELYALVREEEGIFEFLQAGSLDGIWYWDLEKSEHEWMSPRFWEVMGYDWQEKEHLASEWQDLIHPDDLEACIANFEAHIEDPKNIFDQYVRYRHRDGSTVWVRCRGLAIRDENGTPVRMLGAHTDVTLVKKAEEEMGLLAYELSEANEDLRAFSSSISHDLQTPLRAIQRLAVFLEEDYSDRLDDEGRTMLGTLRERSEHMSELIRDVLAFTRLGNTEHTPETIDMGALVRRTFESLLDPQVDPPKWDLRVGELPSAWGDPQMLARVWANLIGNAMKYSALPDGSAVIEVDGRIENGKTLYSVRDHGVGFDMKLSPKMFGLFTRLHADGEFEGNGVGLAFVHRIIKRHGGTIWAEGSPGKGALFTFALPSGPSWTKASLDASKSTNDTPANGDDAPGRMAPAPENTDLDEAPVANAGDMSEAVAGS